MRNLTYLIIILTVGLFSCRTPRFVNAPTAVNAPVLQQKGDSKIAMYYSSNFGNSNENSGNNYNKSKGYDLQGAYALTNHWALQVNYSKRNEKNGGLNEGPFDSSVIDYKRKSGEIGVGYFTKLGNAGNTFFQVFAGGGNGSFELKDAGVADNFPYNRFHTADVNRFYLQPGFTFSKNNVSLILASRFSFINYKKISTDYSIDEQTDFNLTNLQNKTLSFWEPAFILNFGLNEFPPLKLELQLGASYSIDNNYYDTKTGNASVGLVFDFSKLNKMKK